MYNLRYHIASLVGVFLALALGLVLGGLAVQQGTVERQQGALVEGLRREFAQIRDDNQRLAGENENLSDFAVTMIDEWGSERLAGSTVIILHSDGQSDALREAQRAVEAAGGVAVPVTVNEKGLGAGSDEVGTALSMLMRDVTSESIAASLTAEWAFPLQDRPVTAALAEAGMLSADELKPGVAHAFLVNALAFGDEADEAGVDIARAFDAVGRAVGVEVAGTPTGVAAASDQADLASVDHLGTELGRYSLVAVLAGATPAHYGVGPGATAPFPEPPAR